MPVEHFTRDDLHVRVRSPSASHLTWLREFLVPHFRAGKSASLPVEIRLKFDRERFQRALAAPGVGRPVPVFLADTEVMHLSLRPSPPGSLLLHDEQLGLLVTVTEDRREVTVLAEEDSVACRPGLMRVVREYAMNHARSRGEVLLHAAAVLLHGRPIVVTGPKNAGKTTLLIFACHFGGAAVIANDRVLVSPGTGGQHLVRGLPTIVSVRAGNLDFFPGIGRRIHAEGLHNRLHAGEQLGEVHPRPVLGADGRYGLSPLQLCSLLGAEQATGGADPVVVIPRITRRPGRFALRMLGGQEAAAAVEASRFGAAHGATSSPVFNLEPGVQGVGDEALAERRRRFWTSAPVILCEIGENLYDRRENAAAWFEAVFETARGVGRRGGGTCAAR